MGIHRLQRGDNAFLNPEILLTGKVDEMTYMN